MDWQTRRKSIYALVIIVLFFASGVYFLKDIIFPTPTCFDKKQNGYEAGVDCGEVCGMRCSSEVQPLSVLWTRVLKTATSTYDIVGMVSNKNINHAAHSVSYTFTLYDKKGLELKKLKGITVTPISSDFPIIKESIILQEEPETAILGLEDGPHYSVDEKPTSPTLSVSDERYEPGQNPRVYATIQNRKRRTIRNLPVKVILFDENNNAYAVGETIIPELQKEESKVISVTWQNPLPYPPLRIRAYPIFDPFLGAQ